MNETPGCFKNSFRLVSRHSQSPSPQKFFIPLIDFRAQPFIVRFA